MSSYSIRLITYLFDCILKGMTGIRFAKQQRCYINSQTKEFPELTAMEPEDKEMLVWSSICFHGNRLCFKTHLTVQSAEY